MRFTIAALGREGPPSKLRDGRFCFLCPACGEMLAYVNPRDKLAHCFGCGRNFNNIDLLLSLDNDFPSAVTLLERWLNQYPTQRLKNKTPAPRPGPRTPERAGRTCRASPHAGCVPGVPHVSVTSMPLTTQNASAPPLSVSVSTPSAPALPVTVTNVAPVASVAVVPPSAVTFMPVGTRPGAYAYAYTFTVALLFLPTYALNVSVPDPQL